MAIKKPTKEKKKYVPTKKDTVAEKAVVREDLSTSGNIHKDRVGVKRVEPVLKSGTCIFCNDPVTKEPAVYDHACHKECATMQGDKKVRERIKELQNG